MPAAEIAAAVTSVNALLNVAKAMVGLHDAESFRARAIEFEGLILDSLTKAVQATEVQATQLDEIRALKAEVAGLKEWGREKERYELKPNWTGAVAYMLKPDARGSEVPYWLCPNLLHERQEVVFDTARGREPNQEHLQVCDMPD
jgi:hypothetical protein